MNRRPLILGDNGFRLRHLHNLEGVVLVTLSIHPVFAALKRLKYINFVCETPSYDRPKNLNPESLLSRPGGVTLVVIGLTAPWPGGHDQCGQE